MINQLLSQRYEILEKVGEGPLFTVFKARDGAMNRVVAVKVLRQTFLADAKLPGALRTALEETVNLNHPGITRFYEFRDENDIVYSVSEFLRGIDLKERIRRIAPFTLSLAIDFACLMLEALYYANSVGHIHGDLRPQNVVISPEGVLKISGYGQQKASRCSGIAQEAILVYSAPYHAPELSTTGPGTLEGDVYSVGAILYEMLTGATVYAGVTPDEQADAHAFSPIPSARLINPGVPRSVDAIITKCLQKRPDDRYHSIAELLNDLKAVKDALRFGKPLSSMAPDPAQQKPQAATTQQPVPARSPVPVQAAVEDPERPGGYERNRLRAQDERVSIYIKIAIGTVSSLILACGIWAYGIYLAHWIVPPVVPVPDIVGKPIEEVRKLAQDRKFRLKEHMEYNEKPRGIVYQSDQEPGAQLRATHSINVWYSLGPEYVDVPNVVNLTREEAETQLKNVGLKVGRVTPEYNDHVADNVVLAQDVTFKKRVRHDTVVSLTVSNGPNPDSATHVGEQNHGETNPPGIGDAPGDGSPTNPDATGDHANTDNTGNDAANADTHTFSRYISINRDGKGRRQVRVEYKDSNGEHPAVIDEGHDEGDKILIKFDYVGKVITLRVYYGTDKAMERTFDPEATRKRTIR